jgi:predicted DNA-binding transcriptional regulator AlpA
MSLDHQPDAFELPGDHRPAPLRDRLLWSWDDIAALTGLSRRLLEREVSAGRMPPPDVRIGRRACFRPATITAWLDSLAQPNGRG